MRLLRRLPSSNVPATGCVATIGNFDGLHRGHQHVITQLQEKAAELDLPATVISFEPLPAEYFRKPAPSRIYPLRDKLRLLEQLGIQQFACLNFDDALAQMEAEDFVREILIEPTEEFPPVDFAWDEPNGLLAVGGDLSVTRLANAYRSGIFPWFGPQEPIYWWSPNPRAVLFPGRIRISRSLRKNIRNKGYTVTFDRNFPAVVKACAAPRSYTSGTWITEDMHAAYCRLYEARLAHSVEVYNREQQLVGGLYGVVAGGVFCGESMFSREPDTSKIAFVALAYYLLKWGFFLIDCQINNSHLSSMGVEEISRERFKSILQNNPYTPEAADWQIDRTTDLSRWHPVS